MKMMDVISHYINLFLGPSLYPSNSSGRIYAQWEIEYICEIYVKYNTII